MQIKQKEVPVRGEGAIIRKDFMGEITFGLTQWDSLGRRGKRRNLCAKARGHKKTWCI